jgi:hypothetical protein
MIKRKNYNRLLKNSLRAFLLSRNEAKSETRKESFIFSELEELCCFPGYIHVIAYFCFRDNTIKYSDKVETDDVLQQFSTERLVRTEIATLIGLACKGLINSDLPSPDNFQNYIHKTESLLNELHHSMIPPFSSIFKDRKTDEQLSNPFTNGSMLRESIFYGGEAAYQFQYRDLSKVKYKADNEWLKHNKGFAVDQGVEIIAAIQDIQNEKINRVFKELANKTPDLWTFLPAYIFNVDDIASKTNIDTKTVRSLINAFISPVGMESFQALDDFNPTNAYPIINLGNNQYLLLQVYSLVEALYETPFFWFNADKAYKSKAMKHRGEFTEDFSADRLRLVFGAENVFTNIDIYDSKDRIGEIDVLVVFSNRAIVLQAKSKKLTISARKGNDNSLRDDFKKAIHDAYDQAYSCAEFLNNTKFKLVTSEGVELSIDRKYKEIYPFCVVSDHYPALSFQARQFLDFTSNDLIKPPFVMDVFLLDVMTDMLQSPLQLLSYINRRTAYGEKILSTHELTVLSYHLKNNLWIDGEYSMVQLGDDICADLDLAMLTRRDGIPGIETPEGILTRYVNTPFHKLINEIERIQDAAIIDIGFMLLSLSGDTIETINRGISRMVELCLQDGKSHDITLGMSESRSGITIHCNKDPLNIASSRLRNHCERRKYSLKADTWFALCISPLDGTLRIGLHLDYPWIHSNKMNDITKELSPGKKLTQQTLVDFNSILKPHTETGRNQQCPCGSGNKYKKCCLSQ